MFIDISSRTVHSVDLRNEPRLKCKNANGKATCDMLRVVHCNARSDTVCEIFTVRCA